MYFSEALLRWFDQFGRKDLPWQRRKDPYITWLSEIMLQQTQVQTVIPYFNRFIARFPTLTALATAAEDDILALWAGLGYYSRARNLIKTAHILFTEYHPHWPQEAATWLSFPGVGRSTAAAIVSQAFNERAAILDGNVSRVLSRYFMVSGSPKDAKVKRRLWELAEDCLPQQRFADYTQAIMDLGATCCKKHQPNCLHCPLQATCLAYQNAKVGEYPAKPPRKQRPTQEAVFLLIYNEHKEIYIEKQSPKGIWGALWSLPSVAQVADIADYLANYHGIIAAAPQFFVKFKHGFTHFHLILQGYQLSVSSYPMSQPLSPDTQWANAAKLAELGLPKPIKKIIDLFLNSVERFMPD